MSKLEFIETKKQNFRNMLKNICTNEEGLALIKQYEYMSGEDLIMQINAAIKPYSHSHHLIAKDFCSKLHIDVKHAGIIQNYIEMFCEL